MKIIYWNIKGLKNNPTWRALCSMVRKHSPNFLCLAEPMTSMARIPASYWDSFGMVLLVFNVQGQSFPNIWVFHSINILSQTMCSSSSQYLFV